MTVVHNANTFGRIWSADSLDSDGVGLSMFTEGSAVVVEATGEIDASNIDRLTEYLMTALRRRRPLVLDLSKLSFFGAQGVPALFLLGEECAIAGVDWAVVASHPVQRLLRIGDRDHRVPAVASVSEALQKVANPSRARRLLAFVTRSG